MKANIYKHGPRKHNAKSVVNRAAGKQLVKTTSLLTALMKRAEVLRSKEAA